MQTHRTQLSADQIVEETSDWPEDAVADLVDRILRAKYGEVDPSEAVREAARPDYPQAQDPAERKVIHTAYEATLRAYLAAFFTILGFKPLASCWPGLYPTPWPTRSFCPRWTQLGSA
jgi:hypothetical protein